MKNYGEFFFENKHVCRTKTIEEETRKGKRKTYFSSIFLPPNSPSLFFFTKLLCSFVDPRWRDPICHLLPPSPTKSVDPAPMRRLASKSRRQAGLQAPPNRTSLNPWRTEGEAAAKLRQGRFWMERSGSSNKFNVAVSKFFSNQFSFDIVGLLPTVIDLPTKSPGLSRNRSASRPDSGKFCLNSIFEFCWVFPTGFFGFRETLVLICEKPTLRSRSLPPSNPSYQYLDITSIMHVRYARVKF